MPGVERRSNLLYEPAVGALPLDFCHARVADAELCICARYINRLDRMGIVHLAVQRQASVGYLYDLVVAQNGDDESHAESILAGRHKPYTMTHDALMEKFME